MRKKHLCRKILLLLFVVSSIFYVGCKKAESPFEVFSNYSDSWTNQDFVAMYNNISTENKQNITAQDFKQAYENFYKEMRVQSISIELLAEEDEYKEIKNEEVVHLLVNVELQTEYGIKSYKIDVNLIKETIDDKKEWKILWDYNLIYHNMEEGDTIQTKFTSLPVRGEILDRNGKKLAENGVAIQVGIVPGRLGDMKDEIIKELSETFNISEKYIHDRLNLSWVRDDTFVDLKKIPKDQQHLIEQIYHKNTGATFMEIEERVYPYKEAAAHLIGYIGYMNEEELEEWEALGFTASDKIGRTGLEYIFNETLAGRPGKKVVLLDKEGQEKELLFEQETINGEDLHLTVDIDMQAKLYQQLQGEQGTAAVMNYSTGEVLAIVSAPSYDPNKFILGISSDELKKLQEDNAQPLLNRFTQVYSPGSTIKPVTAAIALNENIVDKNFAIDIKGLEWQKDASWGNYYITRVKDPGVPVDMEKAMVYSDNIYFARLALEIGAGTFVEKAKDFGIGEQMSMRYGVKDSQLANNHQIASEILLADTGYGQGEVLLNILNLNKAYSAFINDGNIINPKLISDSTDVDYRSIITKETANEVFDLLLKVVEEQEGTGHGAFIPGKTIAGKTGTAEVPDPNNMNELDELGWFVAIDKSELTPYITSMMVENVKGRGGSKVAIDKVNEFIRGYSNY